MIDVGASADDARTAWAALRVARETLVAVPTWPAPRATTRWTGSSRSGCGQR